MTTIEEGKYAQQHKKYIMKSSKVKLATHLYIDNNDFFLKRNLLIYARRIVRLKTIVLKVCSLSRKAPDRSNFLDNIIKRFFLIAKRVESVNLTPTDMYISQNLPCSWSRIANKMKFFKYVFRTHFKSHYPDIFKIIDPKVCQRLQSVYVHIYIFTNISARVEENSQIITSLVNFLNIIKTVDCYKPFKVFLTFDLNKYTNEDIDSLLSVLIEHKNIVYISFGANSFAKIAFHYSYLLNTIGSLKNLRKLNLSILDVHMSKNLNTLNEAAETFGHLKLLKELSLKFTKIVNKEDLYTLLISLGLMSNLKVLGLYLPDLQFIDERMIISFAQSLTCLTNLEKLDLKFEKAKEIAKTSPQYIEMNKIYYAVRSLKCFLLCLNTSNYTDNNDAIYEQLGRFISFMPNLRMLFVDLFRRNTKTESLSHFLKGLRNITGLEILDIRFGIFFDPKKDIIKFISGLNQLKDLSVLNIHFGCNDIEGDLVLNIMNIIRKMRKNMIAFNVYLFSRCKTEFHINKLVNDFNKDPYLGEDFQVNIRLDRECLDDQVFF